MTAIHELPALDPCELYSERDAAVRLLSDPEIQARPLVEGFTCDTAGTFSREHGVSIDNRDGKKLVGFHIIDTSIFPMGGSIDLLGCRMGESRPSVADYKQLRMLGDDSLYKHFNLSQSATETHPVPTLSFYFECIPRNTGPDELRLRSVERSRFVSVGAYDYAESRSPRYTGDAELLINHMRAARADNRRTSLRNSVGQLSDLTNQYAALMANDMGIPLLEDANGRVSLHRPLRRWADFKNVQLVSAFVAGLPVSYAPSAQARMQQEIQPSPGVLDFSPEILVPSKNIAFLADLFDIENPKEHEIANEEFLELLQHFDPDGGPESDALTPIIRWAVNTGRIVELTTNERFDRNNMTVRFHNLEEPISVNTGTSTTAAEAQYELIVRYLQKFKRVDVVNHSRVMLLDLTRTAQDHQMLPPQARAALQRIRGIKLPRR